MAYTVAILTVLLAFTTLSVADDTLALVKIKHPDPVGAKCLDGSPPAYYFRPGTGGGASKWLIFYEGGGWCLSLDDCYNRSLIYSGSSDPYADTLVLDYGYFSSNRTVNPLFWNWNIAYLKYCDGGSFSGNNDTVTNYKGHYLYFRGFKITQAIRNSLYSKGLGSSSDVVITGCSAGGLATYLQLDWWAANLPSAAKVTGLPDSGFFPDYNNYNALLQLGVQLRWTAKQMNISSDKNCMKANVHEPEKCFFAQYVVPHIGTPMFALGSIYDLFQTSFMLGGTDWFTGEIYNASAVNAYGEYFYELFSSAGWNSKSGYFLDACNHHCFTDVTQSNADGLVLEQAFNRWYSPNKAVAISKLFPCVDCCPAA